MKLEAGVRYFENNNEEYVKIRKTVEEKVHSILVDRKELLGRAVLCVIESIRMDPDKYDPLIYYNDHNNTFSILHQLQHPKYQHSITDSTFFFLHIEKDNNNTTT
jgi:hypothetical protein